MKTTNWQTKALTLFIAAAALWLIAACGNADTDIEAPPTQAVTEAPTVETTAKATEASTREPTAVPTIEATETPVGEATEETAATSVDETSDQESQCTTESPQLTSRLNTSEEEFLEHLENQNRAGGVLYVHEALFWRQPNVYHVSESFLKDENDEWTDKWGITVWVTEKVDQNTLPPENRIPDTLDDVTIQITQAEPPPKVAAIMCDYSMCRTNSEEGETTMTTTNRNTPERRHEVRLKYDPLFWRQPNVFGVGEGSFGDGRGGFLKTKGIVISVTHKVDQSTLPSEDRIPDCLEGIPVQVVEEDPPVRQ